MTKEFLELLNKAIDDALNHAHYSALHPDIEKPIEHNEWKNQWLIKNIPQQGSINTNVVRPVSDVGGGELLATEAQDTVAEALDCGDNCSLSSIIGERALACKSSCRMRGASGEVQP